MKKLWIILSSVLLLVSCSKTAKEKAEELCKNISSNFSLQTLAEAKKEFNSLSVNELDREPAIKSIEKSLLSVKYSKSIPASNVVYEITGSCSPFLALLKENYSVELTGDGNTGFSIFLKLKNKMKFQGLQPDKIEGYIEFLNAGNSSIGKYKIYHIPDLLKLIDNKISEASFRVFLDPVFDPFAKEPFDLAITAMKKVEAMSSFRLHLDLFFQDSNLPAGLKEKPDSKNEDKEYEDILNKLDNKH